MDPTAAPPRKLRKIRRTPKTVKYGYNGQHEGTPEQAASYMAAFGRMYLPAQPTQYDAQPAKEKKPQALSRAQHGRTIALPRTRSREMSHAPRSTARSTPKTASRSGDSDPAGPEPPPRRRFIVDSHYFVVAVVG